jgi:hypothetical protein
MIASVLDTPVLQTINDDTPDPQRLVCCGDTEKLTLVYTGPVEAAGDLIDFRLKL